jgi:hypothetical protein
MISFDYVKFEVLISGSWVDLTPDVLENPHPRGNRGIASNDPEARVGMPGELRFSLNNGEGNSAGLIGRYSPGHANCLTGWKSGLPVRVSFAYDSWQPRVKWRGWIDADGLDVKLGAKGLRRVDVMCHDYMWIATHHKLSLLAPATDRTASQAVRLILDNMPIQPQETELTTNAADLAMPFIFDGASPDTSALGEFNRIATSNQIYIFSKGGGGANSGDVLVTTFAGLANDRIPKVTDRCGELLMETGGSNFILQENGDPILLDETETFSLDNTKMIEGTEVSYGKHLCNYCVVVAQPRRVDTSDVIMWSLEKATQLGAGESITLRGRYRDPVGGSGRVSMSSYVTPVSGTDYAAFANSNGSGANLTANMSVTTTAGASEAEFTVTNTGGSAFWFGGPSITFQIRGKLAYFFDPVRLIASDETSMNTYGVKPRNIELFYQDSPTGKDDIAQIYVDVFKDPQYVWERVVLWANTDNQTMPAFLWIEPNYKITIADTMTGQAANDWHVNGYEFELFGAPSSPLVKWTLTVTYL